MSTFSLDVAGIMSSIFSNANILLAVLIPLAAIPIGFQFALGVLGMIQNMIGNVFRRQ